MAVEFLLQAFAQFRTEDAIVHENQTYSYIDLLQEYQACQKKLQESRLIAPGKVVTLEADFSLSSTAMLLALVAQRCIVVPLSDTVTPIKHDLKEIARIETVVEINGKSIDILDTGIKAQHALYDQLIAADSAGLVLFSSGSTGKRKAIVHDFNRILTKFHAQRPKKRAICFYLFDHIGGIDTLLHTLSNGGCVITVPDRQPQTVCQIIEKHRAEVLPASPTFINLLLLSEYDRQYDLSSVQIVTYGTEVMPQSTLDRLCERIPWVKTLQKYGLSEVGALRSKSKDNNSTWVKLGGEGIDLRVVDDMLEIKSNSSMLGYLNADSPFIDDGWFKTDDKVEVQGEYFRILGRESDHINIGGEKFFPAEAEEILMKMQNVADVAISARPNPITGQMVVGKFLLKSPQAAGEFRKALRQYCQQHLPSYMTPQKIIISDSALHSDRYKKQRLPTQKAK